MYCERCGTQVQQNANFCPKCGYRFNQNQQNANVQFQYVQPNPSFQFQYTSTNPNDFTFEKKHSKLSIVACVFAGIAFIFPMFIVVGYILSLVACIVGLIDVASRNKTEKHTGSWFAIFVFVVYSAIVFIPIAMDSKDDKPSSRTPRTHASEETRTERQENTEKDNDIEQQNNNIEEQEYTEQPLIYESEITFRDIPWGTSYTEVAKQLPEFELFAISGDSFKTMSVDDIALGDYQGLDFEYNDINIIGNCFNKETEVAGYTTTDIELYFAYLPVDGQLPKTEEASSFYGAKYIFQPKNLNEAHSDLKEKLSSIYGQYSEEFSDTDMWENEYTYTYWYGQNDTMLVLKCTNSENDTTGFYTNEIEISYIWKHGDKMLQDASDTLLELDVEKEKEAYSNGQNDGL